MRKVNISVSIDLDLANWLDGLIKDGEASSVSAVINMAVRNYKERAEDG